jgi:predicted double-glycine peptidase
MLMIFLGVLAVAIIGFGVNENHPPVDRPKNEYALPMKQVGGGVSPQAVAMKPLSDFKFDHIVKQAYDYSCGSAALTTILRFHLGIDVTEQQVMEGMLAHGERDKIIQRRGFSLLDMKRYVATLGSVGAGFRAEMSDLEKLEEPAIVPIDYAGSKHFVVFRGIRHGRVLLADPSAGHIAFSVEDFAKLWDRNTLFVIYPSTTHPAVASSLRLTDHELGLIDPDLVRTDEALRMDDRSVGLDQAVDHGLGMITRH